MTGTWTRAEECSWGERSQFEMYLGESSLDSWVDEPFTGKGIIAVRAVLGVRKEQT